MHKTYLTLHCPPQYIKQIKTYVFATKNVPSKLVKSKFNMNNTCFFSQSNNVFSRLCICWRGVLEEIDGITKVIKK